MLKLLQVIFLSLVVASFTDIKGQFNPPSGAKGAGMAGVDLCTNDVWSGISNPSNRVLSKGIYGGVSSTNYLPETIGLLQGVGGYQGKVGWGGVALQRVYFSKLHFNSFKCFYGRQLGRELAIGLAVGFNSIEFEDQYYGNSIFPSYLLSLKYAISERLIFICALSDVHRQSMNRMVYQRFPSRLRVGLNAVVHPQFHVTLEVEANANFGLVSKVAMDWELAPKLEIFWGYQSGLSALAFGFGWKRDRVKFAFASQYHAFLGFTPSVSISFVQ